MHFVKKVPTTQEQKEAKEKERTAKLQVFSTLRNKIFARRSEGRFDEDLLALTAKLLKSNPDITTFWNIRRETICAVSKKKDDEDERTAETRKKNLLDGELFLTKECLKTNCKSYSAWFHRGWVLENMNEPIIEDELNTCERFLQLDGRNFHGWDHRRFVAKLGRKDPKDELEFSTRLINGNFSNYSSWHYRSSLLRDVFPNSQDKISVSEAVLKDELKMVSNAFFVDPADQSAWIYTEWLLGLTNYGRRGISLGTAKASVLSVTYEDKQTAYLVLDYSVNVNDLTKAITYHSEHAKPLHITPISVYGKATSASVFQLDGGAESGPLTLELYNRTASLQETISIDFSKTYINENLFHNVYGFKKGMPSCLRKDAIEEVADICKCLLEESASENEDAKIVRWPLFIRTLCLMATDPFLHNDEIMLNFEKLKDICDPQRKLMYSEISAKLRVNSALNKELEKGELLLHKVIHGDADIVTLRLPNMGLQCLNHLVPLSGFIKVLDLTDNFISDICVFVVLPRLTHLTLDGNPIKNLRQLCWLRNLKYLSVARTGLDCAACVSEIFETETLERFVFCETTLANDDTECRMVYEKNKERDKKLTIVRHWL